MKKQIRQFALGAILILALVLTTACSQDAPPSSPGEEPGETPEVVAFEFPEESGEINGMANFSTLDIYGSAVDPTVFSDYDLTMVNIWGTFCSPCLDEMPYLAEITVEYKERGFQIIGLVVDVQYNDGSVNLDQIDKAVEIANATGASYPHLIPSEYLIEGIVQHVQYIPYTVFVDSEGNMVGEAYVGSRSKEQWIEIIEAML
jgi:thiol-disulfide isomerase/thioredoxin